MLNNKCLINKLGQDSISQKPQEVNHEKKECKEDKGKDNDEQSSKLNYYTIHYYEQNLIEIERMIDKIVNKNDLKAKQAKIKEENPIRRSERTRNKATGFNYFDSYGMTNLAIILQIFWIWNNSEGID